MGDTSLIRTALLVAVIAAFGLAAPAARPLPNRPQALARPFRGLRSARDNQLPSALRTGFSDSGGAFQPFCWAMT